MERSKCKNVGHSLCIAQKGMGRNSILILKEIQNIFKGQIDQNNLLIGDLIKYKRNVY